MKKGSKMSESSKKLMSIKKIGYTPWNKGKKGISIKHDKQFKKGTIPWNKGIPMSDDQRRKLSASRKGKYGGKKHPSWSGGKFAYKKRLAKLRDNNKCQKCGYYNNEWGASSVDVDHILPKKKYPELANEIDNLVTLCPNCHRIKTLKEKDHIHL